MMYSKRVESWGRMIREEHRIYSISYPSDYFPDLEPGMTVLPYGEGRSYGDVCLNEGQGLLETRRLNRFIKFDEAQGLIRCEAGVRLDELLAITLPKGWFIPVSPGTQFVTIGGAIANDIHGKNHHREGTFGRHVTQFEILRSNNQRILCSPTENTELFSATIAGLGLTGLILWAEIKLKKVSGPWIDQETIRFANLDEFFSVSEESEQNFDYTVAWVDTLSTGDRLGRGLFFRGNHSEEKKPEKKSTAKIPINFDAPENLLNPLTVKAFNQLYYRKHWKSKTQSTIHYKKFFYPLDALSGWNRLYGKRGFYQYQLVVPYQNDRKPIRAILEKVSQSEVASFLAVLKTFGNLPSPGMLSFPRSGVTLALDFPNLGEKTKRLFQSLDSIVRECGGALYPAKDAHMAGRDFQNFFPRWKEFAKYQDPRFSSSFWRRVSKEETHG